MLESLGLDSFFQEAFEPHRRTGRRPGRVAAVHRTRYEVLTEDGPLSAELSGKLRHSEERPVAGDWVLLEHGAIRGLLPRRTAISRRVGHETQVLAANVDTVFLVTSLNRDLNKNRLDRYLALVGASGARAAIVLTKADLGEEAPDLSELGVPVHVTSAHARSGLSELKSYFQGSRTVALLGSSGAGKSSLANALLGEERQAVAEIDENDRGRHATTVRELFLVPGGGLLLDTPGLRSVGLDEGELPALVERSCRFRDCRHESEPGCAVLAAVEAGELDEDRVESWRKLEVELGREVAKAQRKQARAARGKQRPSDDWKREYS